MKDEAGCRKRIARFNLIHKKLKIMYKAHNKIIYKKPLKEFAVGSKTLEIIKQTLTNTVSTVQFLRTISLYLELDKETGCCYLTLCWKRL